MKEEKKDTGKENYISKDLMSKSQLLRMMKAQKIIQARLEFLKSQDWSEPQTESPKEEITGEKP